MHPACIQGLSGQKGILVPGLEHVFTLVPRVVRDDMGAKEEVPSRLEPECIRRGWSLGPRLPCPVGSPLIVLALPGVLGER